MKISKIANENDALLLTSRYKKDYKRILCTIMPQQIGLPTWNWQIPRNTQAIKLDSGRNTKSEYISNK